MELNLKRKLIIYFSVIILMTELITAIIGTYLITRGVVNQVQDKVRTDLNSAREILHNRIDEIKKIIAFSTVRGSIKRALLANDRNSLLKYLQQVKDAGNLEMLAISDRNGRVILRLHNPDVYGDGQANDQILSKVLARKEALSSPVIVRREELEKDGREFAERAYFKYIPTPKAKKMEKTEETAGMMLKAAAPIWSDDGAFIGILYGGDLINRNYHLVDKIKDTVYQGEMYKDKDMGTATIFQQDLRISTNVMNDQGERAIGTRVSEEVHNKVLGEGKEWFDRAFVVNAWYITAYEPIMDIDNAIIGILYVGMLEEKFMDMKWKALLIFFAVTFLGMILVLIVSNLLANTITRPINYLARVSQQISEGDFSVNVDVKTRDELGKLEKAFNSMARALQERDEELQKQTQRQLMRSEKLAALGRMAAGIAHEINNPLTGILMYGHLLLKNLPENSRDWQDINIIVNETTRCRKLIRDLLDFSRESEPQKQQVDINQVINKIISIIENQVYFEKVAFIKKFADDLPGIMIDENQLEQVVINLALNSAEAMEDGGNFIVETLFDSEKNEVIIRISDTGCGIPEEDLDKIFEPFFTTKEVGKGTGLGLAISYGILKKHGGHINVESQIGKGTTFTLAFPVENVEVTKDRGDN